MDRYSLIVVTDETSPIRRLDIRRVVIHRALAGLAVLVLLGGVGIVDWVLLRIDQPEFIQLRERAEGDRAKIEAFETELAALTEELQRVREFERKVRIIANLPGAAGAGGGGDVEIIETEDGELAEVVTGEGEPLLLPGEELPDAEAGESDDEVASLEPGERASAMRTEAARLGLVAVDQQSSLQDILTALEAKQHKLASSPAIWPTKGWLTSRFGYRTSPFTNKRQFHSGIDIAGRKGSDVIAPARGKVTRVGTRGPLGKSVTIEHGFGIKTTYGHLDETHVKRGQEVDRGQVIAALGNTGRSTGPHLHYSVSVNGKSVNPLDYIFD